MKISKKPAGWDAPADLSVLTSDDLRGRKFLRVVMIP